MTDPGFNISVSLSEALATTATFEDAATQLAQFAVTARGSSSGGITLIHGGGKRFETIAPTTPQVEHADYLQYSLRQGPCVDAATESRSVSSSRLATDERWPTWGPQAADLGFSSILSTEIHAQGHRIGAMNIYGDDQTDFAHFDLEIAKQLAIQASSVLGFARQSTQLQAAVETRTLIGQAQGILMERFGMDAENSFAVLQRYSQHTNKRLHAVCQDLVETRAIP